MINRGDLGITTHRNHQSRSMNAQIRDLIMEEMDKSPDTKLGCATGWSGPKDLLSKQRCASLLSFIEEKLPLGSWAVHGWGNIMVSGDSVDRHDHSRSHVGGLNELAGCYYVETPFESSPIEFWPDARQSLMILAQEGLLILFPAGLVHSVPTNSGLKPRISIGINIRRANARVS